MSSTRKLTRSRTSSMLGGVCGGLGEYFDIDPTIIRLAFVALILFGMGSPLLGYILLWIIIPRGDGVQVKAELPVTMPEPATESVDEAGAVMA